MPRPKRTTSRRMTQSILKKDNSINSTLMDTKVMDNNHLKLDMWKAEVKDRIKDTCQKLDDMHEQEFAMLDLQFNNSLMAIPNNVLNTVIDMKCEEFRSFILGVKKENLQGEPSLPSMCRSTARRRSRSASNSKYRTRASQRVFKTRSTSVDVYQVTFAQLLTPRGRMRLSTIMSHKKYTVTKPKKTQDSGVNVRRIMKPGEEAISTCGSPLYVSSGNLVAPHVNIPLPGGVVLNIEPKSPKGPLEIPSLDMKTKSQIKMLYEQLKKLC